MLTLSFLYVAYSLEKSGKDGSMYGVAAWFFGFCELVLITTLVLVA